MKEHQIQVVTKDNFLLNGVPEESSLEKALSNHDVGKHDIITLVLGNDVSQVTLSYEIYQDLKTLGFGNIDFSGSARAL